MNKKWIFPFTVIAALTACSSNKNEAQLANDIGLYQQPVKLQPLANGGVNLPAPNPTYQLAPIVATSAKDIDIRPPSVPLAIIQDSIAQFDGNRSSIVYHVDEENIYNWQQIQRVLTEQNINFKPQQGNQLDTDWVNGKAFYGDDKLDIRYQVVKLQDKKANALAVAILQLRKNGVISAPDRSESQRYSADLLNLIVSSLNASYAKQSEQLLAASKLSAIESTITTDRNNRVVLLMDTDFAKAWYQLDLVLPLLGFTKDKQDNTKGTRELQYKPINPDDWKKFGAQNPNLPSSSYNMQLSLVNSQQSSLMITDRNKTVLLNHETQAVYTAIKNILASGAK